MSKKKFNENTNLNLYDVSKDIISFWKKIKYLRSQLKIEKIQKYSHFMKDHHQLMAYQVFIM